MFYFAYDSYLDHAFPYDELKPISCTGWPYIYNKIINLILCIFFFYFFLCLTCIFTGMDTWGSFSLTLIDALDTLVIMGNYTEFERAAELVCDIIN